MVTYDLYPLPMRREDNIYGIASSMIHSHEFMINETGPTILEICHVMENSQDHTLRTWISNKPVGGYFFPTDDMDYWSMSRASRQLIFYNLATLTREDRDKNGLAYGVIYYINIQNLQNAGNTYYLEFSN